MDSAYSYAVASGFSFIATNDGKAVDGTWYCAFTKNVERKGPRLFVGLKDGKWDSFIEEEVK